MTVMYRCPTHGWMEDSGEVHHGYIDEEDREIHSRWCRVSIGMDETCGMDLTGPHQVKIVEVI